MLKSMGNLIVFVPVDSLPFSSEESYNLLLCFPSGTTLGQSPLGQIQLTIRHSSQRNKLVVVVHSCR